MSLVVLVACGGTGATDESAVERAALTTTTTTATTTVPTTTTTTAPPTTTTSTTAPPPPTTAAAPRPPSCCAHWTIEPYRGVGAWVDVFDWTLTHSNGNPAVGLDDIDAMPGAGVRTLFIQTARPTSPADVVEPDRLRRIIARAHGVGLRVVTWYLPTFVDLEVDLRRLTAAAALPVDGLTVNVESEEVPDPDERSRRLVELSRRLKTRLGGAFLGTVILNPLALEDLAPQRWPDFPWAAIDPFYEVWQPMLYVSYRPAGTELRDARRYTSLSIARLRGHVGDDAIHPVTGIGNLLSQEDFDGYARAAIEARSVGGGVYDWATTPRPMWARLSGIGA